MSKPKYYWFSFVQKTITHCLHGRMGQSTQDKIASKAVLDSLEETAKMADGDRRIKLIMILYHRCTHTVAGASMLLYISERTAQKWNSDFVYLVARNMGFLCVTDIKKDGRMTAFKKGDNHETGKNEAVGAYSV